MGAALQENEIHDELEGEHGDVLGLAPEHLEVRRHAVVAAGVFRRLWEITS